MVNQQVSDYIDKAPEQQKQIMEAIRRLIQESVPHVKEEFKWSRPVFRAEKDFAYLKTAKAYVTVGFFNYKKLDDKNNLLEGTSNDMRHIKLKTVDAIDSKLLKKWFQTAAR